MPANYVPPPKDRCFPLKAVLLASFLPALLGLSCGLFIFPPEIDYDTVVGLEAWANYLNGRAWNTLPRVDPDNISGSIDHPLTWWPPGQYLPLGLLSLTGLPLGTAALIVASLCVLSLGVGGAALVNSLNLGKGDMRILPWVSATFACSHYALINFYHFWGGETGLMALLPWVVLIAWKLRNHSLLSFLVLPWVFLLGSFIKHSFAIHAICIISFLFLETTKSTLNSSERRKKDLQVIIRKGLLLSATGIAYIVLQSSFITKETASPINPAVNEDLFSLSTYLGYSSWAPLLAPWGLGTLMEMYIPRFFDLEMRALVYLGPLLSMLSPLAIGFYIWLSFGKKPLTRLAGVSALLTSGIHFFIYHSGGIIELRDRYYQFPAFLFLAVAATQIFQNRWRGYLGKFLVGGAILIGTVNLIRGSIMNKNWRYHDTKANIAHLIPDAVAQKIEDLISKSEYSIIIRGVAPHLNTPINPSIGIMVFDAREGPRYGSIRGRVPLIVSAHWDKLPISRFKDYSEEEWETYEIESWIIQAATTPNSTIHSE